MRRFVVGTRRQQAPRSLPTPPAQLANFNPGNMSTIGANPIPDPNEVVLVGVDAPSPPVAPAAIPAPAATGVAGPVVPAPPLVGPLGSRTSR